ncbi:DUF6492 family protein [Georgenia sp. Z1344]|uniref:DUF6492 family protein n=1 Tax=Georgenia sp. Z1344 TaxID=3416706 RepID=UPI003CF56D8B
MTTHRPSTGDTSTMAIVTPTYRPDFHSFRRLHDSVLRHTDESVVHHAAVPGIDVDLYRGIDSPRLAVWSYQEVVPEGIIPTDRLAAATRRVPFLSRRLNCAGVSRRRPWQPIRGWVMQQLIKLNMAAHVDADALVFVDSDVVLVRRTHVSDFVRDGSVHFYSKDGGITRSMHRHHRWCQVAHELLGLPWQDRDAYPDHVAGIVTYDRELVDAGLGRVEEVTGRPWAVALARHLHLSEDVLYGTYVRHFGRPKDRDYESGTPRCHSHWSPTPMDAAEADDFVEGFGPEHRAVHIQSTSDTDDALVRSIVSQLEKEYA